MIEGKIIKFYREKARLTQGQLCEGICSITHLSKIERGITEYSKEITNLLADRLGIKTEDELSRYYALSKKLNQWEEAMIMQRTKESQALKMELETETLIGMPEFQILFKLLSARYYLFNNKVDSAYDIIQGLQKHEADLSLHNQNMLKHIWGIYYFVTGQFRDCISCLTAIDHDQYNNEEYFYHLAIAYHSIHSNITAYYYGKKALQFFQRTLNILRIIDTEMMLVVQLNAKELHDFKETKEKYEQLLNLCDSVHSSERKGKIYHNLGFECFRRKMYQESANYYIEAMKLMDEGTPIYLTTLDSYVHTCFRGNLTSVDTLVELSADGLKKARELNSTTWIDFQLNLYELKGDEENFYRFIEETVLPHFRKIGYVILIDHYERKLFQYYSAKGDNEKALELASAYINSKKSFYDHE
ncbi:helix-turn-helix domain-containing protein [Bacillus salacetis]|uniref:helix-turn-helix domain-containing protein n=1 Tax=Bacillus salacetis TaxID=2315464 RepID=UPI003B9FAB8E